MVRREFVLVADSACTFADRGQLELAYTRTRVVLTRGTKRPCFRAVRQAYAVYDQHISVI